MGAYTESAIFIKLKPGIAWDPRIGSYSMAYRGRILGVFDDETGRPIDSATVSDSASGMFALTTNTGTISLGFLPDGTSTLRISKHGYEPVSFHIDVAPGDTTPVTIVLRSAKHP